MVAIEATASAQTAGDDSSEEGSSSSMGIIIIGAVAAVDLGVGLVLGLWLRKKKAAARSHAPRAAKMTYASATAGGVDQAAVELSIGATSAEGGVQTHAMPSRRFLEKEDVDLPPAYGANSIPGGKETADEAEEEVSQI